jgi:hypothetical protein
MRITPFLPTGRRAAMALAAGSVSAVLAAPLATNAAVTHTATERPDLSVTSIRSGVVSLHAMTHPALTYAEVYFYELVNGQRHLLGSDTSGHEGHAHLRVHLRPGTVHRFEAKVMGLNNRHRFRAPAPNTRYRSRYSAPVSYRTP